MREIRTSGLMSGEGRRDDAGWPESPRPSSTLLSACLSADLHTPYPRLHMRLPCVPGEGGEGSGGLLDERCEVISVPSGSHWRVRLCVLERLLVSSDQIECRISGTDRHHVGEVYLGLLVAAAPDSGAAKRIAENGESMSHPCVEMNDVDAARIELRRKGIRLPNETSRISHPGSPIGFLRPQLTGNILIELADPRPGSGRPEARP
jgi:hypothetical protein